MNVVRRISRFLCRFRPTVSVCCAILLITQLVMLAPVYPAETQRPQIRGYGVQSCAAYLEQFDGWERGEEAGIVEYLRYRAWFSGLVTGLSLATGSDVLRGVEVKDAMRRLRVYCSEHTTEDFFAASKDLIRTLSLER